MITADDIKYLDIKALWWRQPYATMMLYGKQETRTWNTPYRGLVLICSTLQPFNQAKTFEHSGAKWTRIIKSTLEKNRYPVLNGHALAVGRLVGTKFMGDYRYNPKTIEEIEAKTYVQFAWNLYIHEYEDVRPIKPFPLKGSQGWKPVTRDIRQQIVLL